MSRQKILVHICCAPDALYVMNLLKEEYHVHGYFYNPNIHPLSEYNIRAEETRKVAGILGFPLFEGPYDEERWHKLTKKFRQEPEKGRRCDICYAMRLQQTAAKAVELGLDAFTSVMSLSPWKKAMVINRTGRMFSRRTGLFFLEADFKKKDGFRKSIIMSQDAGLYRQNYCGCLYSRKDK